MIKVGVCGSHGVGKTTFLKDLTTSLEEQKYKPILVEEVARECPLPINEDVFLASETWITLTQITHEMEVMYSPAYKNDSYAVLLTDRTILDQYAYALSFMHRKRKQFVGVKLIQNLLNYWIRTYNLVFHLKPLPTPPVDDGVRSIDPLWQQEIDRIINRLILQYKLHDNSLVKAPSGVVHTIHTTNRQRRVEEAMLHLTPLLKDNSRKKINHTTSKLVQKQIPVQEAIL